MSGQKISLSFAWASDIVGFVYYEQAAIEPTESPFMYFTRSLSFGERVGVNFDEFALEARYRGVVLPKV